MYRDKGGKTPILPQHTIRSGMSKNPLYSKVDSWGFGSGGLGVFWYSKDSASGTEIARSNCIRYLPFVGISGYDMRLIGAAVQMCGQ